MEIFKLIIRNQKLHLMPTGKIVGAEKANKSIGKWLNVVLDWYPASVVQQAV